MKYTVEEHELTGSFCIHEDGKPFINPHRTRTMDLNIAHGICRFLNGNMKLNEDNASKYQDGYDDAIRMMLS